ncbi:hypothetical protein TCAL_15837 [Tigriopus californicus]|uniref:Neurotransmitter-gated ion-channel ligand-binding domain-containing protein n=1 Tax=Tigriopus californicus TaxID=6832 RepID=A0A553NPQ3_TIGCA|nr:hypothetical protein TCAL_15837 [Tigriopus californicus]
MDVSAVEDVHYTITIHLSTFVMWNDSRLIINDTVLQDLSVKNRWYGLTPELASMHLPIEELRMGPFLLDGNEILFKAKTTTILEFATSFMELGPANQTEEMEFFHGLQDSWVAFVIPIEAIPGRVSVIFTTFLVLINIATSAFSNSPPSQGINYIQ